MHPFHPFAVHLPIGLLAGAVILTIWYLRVREPSLESAAFHCLRLGTVFTLPSIVLGTWDAVDQLTREVSPRTDALMWINAHAFTSIAMLVVYWGAWQARRRNPGILDDPVARRGYLTRLGIGSALLFLTGWLGGQLVYSLRLGVAL